VIPQLRKLEAKYQDSLVVIGVHAGKYHAERVTENIATACARLEVEHPVVNDRQFRVWRAYAVNAWPTIVLIDPQGYYLGSQPGEISFDDFDPLIGGLVEQYGAAGVLDRRPQHFTRPRPVPVDGLYFPTKVLADETGGRLFIADHGHNRVLVATLDGPNAAHVTAIAGSGTAGYADGPFATAQFDHPNGLALAGETLYVADTENHRIRAVDLATQIVHTVAGSGDLGYRRMGGPPLQTALNSPWDLWVQGDILYIAMAGTHQIWTLQLPDGAVAPYAGNGREAIKDDVIAAAELAQPMGLTAADGRLYFACAESQAVRGINLDGGSSARVTTIVGTDLFDFGDRDGRAGTVRLQHCQGLAWHAGALYVADTYNSKIKRIDPATRECATWLGQTTPRSGEVPPRDWVDDPVAAAVELDEPAGLSAAHGHLYIADTNHHRIVVADLTTRAAGPLTLTGV
jgi:DNA-binding beta-propeller fold protein YncE